MPQEPEESASSALEAMASSLAFEVECAYDGLSAEKELSAAELSAKLTWTRSECTKLKKRRKNLAKEARRVEAEAAASKSAASALEARHAKLVEALSEKRARRDDVALERLTRERAARGPADEGPLRRRELHVALGDLERVRKELAHLDNNNETLRRELRKFQRASGFVEDVKDERESSEEEEEEPHLKPPQYAVATPIDVVHVSCEDLDDDASSSSGQQRHLLMTLRVLDDDDDASGSSSACFYRVPRRQPLAQSVGAAHARRRGVEDLDFFAADDDDAPLDLSRPPLFDLDDLALLRCRRRGAPSRRPSNADNRVVVVVVRNADAAVDDAYYGVDRDDMLDGLFKAHIAASGWAPSLGFFTANGDRQIRPAETAADLHFNDVAFLMAL